MRKLTDRCILVKWIGELIGEGKTYDEVYWLLIACPLSFPTVVVLTRLAPRSCLIWFAVAGEHWAISERPFERFNIGMLPLTRLGCR